MILMLLQNTQSAFRSIWQNKVQSALAIIGVVIGVGAVTTLVGLGQGLKNDVSGLIQGLGTNDIFVLSGKINTSSGASIGSSGNPANFLASDILTLQDTQTVAELPNIDAVSPISLVTGELKYTDKSTTPTIFGAYPNVLQIFSVLGIDKGAMFSQKASGNVIVLSSQASQDLFGNTDPVGQKVFLGTTELSVIGTLTKPKSSSIFGSQLDSLSMIPFDTATALNKNQVKIYRLAIKAADDSDVKQVQQTIRQAILQNHHNTEDFSVLTQEDLLGLLGSVVNLVTTLVSAIAAISLIVGGIGIMNIMLVTVTERTREIGLRKAVGATARAILLQFLIESLVITFVGGLLGLALAFATTAIVAARTSLNPQINAQVILLAVGISVVIGVIFGLWPAVRAARKDPIEALRYE